MRCGDYIFLSSKHKYKVVLESKFTLHPRSLHRSLCLGSHWLCMSADNSRRDCLSLPFPRYIPTRSWEQGYLSWGNYYIRCHAVLWHHLFSADLSPSCKGSQACNGLWCRMDEQVDYRNNKFSVRYLKDCSDNTVTFFGHLVLLPFLLFFFFPLWGRLHVILKVTRKSE